MDSLTSKALPSQSGTFLLVPYLRESPIQAFSQGLPVYQSSPLGEEPSGEIIDDNGVQGRNNEEG